MPYSSLQCPTTKIFGGIQKTEKQNTEIHEIESQKTENHKTEILVL
jgi:hypothetical protein